MNKVKDTTWEKQSETDILNKTLSVVIDTEYTDDYFLTLQIFIPRINKKIIVINNNLKTMLPNKTAMVELVKTEFENAKKLVDLVYFLNLDSDSHTSLHDILVSVLKEDMPNKVDLIFFYAIRDVFGALGYNRNAFTRGDETSTKNDVIRERRNISGQLIVGNTTYRLCDVSGLTNSSLLDFAASQGIEMESKNTMALYKESMHEALLNSDPKIREDFLRYSMDDTVKLFQIFESFKANYNTILRDLFHLPDKYLFVEGRFPLTVGYLVSASFERFLFNYIENKEGVDPLLFKKSIFKLGYLGGKNAFHKNALKIQELKEERTKIYRDLSDDVNLINSHCSRQNYSFDAFGLCSIPFLESFDKKKTYASSSFIAGGRHQSLRYLDCQAKNVLDIDIGQAYGTVLNELAFPIGTPEIYVTSVNEFGITLREFLKRYEHNLIEQLWTITVSGKLSFDQELIYSKIATRKQVDWSKTGDWQVNFVEHEIFRNEISFGLITSDLLHVLRKICTNKEINEFMNLRVDSAIYFKKDNKFENIENWCNYVMNPKVKSDSNRAWFSLPFDKFIGPLSQTRIKLKSEMRNCIDPRKKAKLKSQDTAAKLIINTTYGAQASAFFRSGNVIIGNVITAKVRTFSWLMAISLNGSQIVTDGNSFSPEKCFYLKKVKDKKYNKKPGIHFLSDSYRLARHKSIRQKNIFKDIANFTETSPIFIGNANYNKLEDITLKHIKDFWTNYNINFPFKIELKQSHTAFLHGYIGKSHNVFGQIDGVISYKTRGYKERVKGIRNPLHKLLDDLALGKTLNVLNPNYFQIERISIFVYNQKKRKDKTYDIRPGTYLIVPRTFKLKPAQLPLRNKEDFSRLKRFGRQNICFLDYQPEARGNFEKFCKLGFELIRGKQKRGKKITKI